VTGLLVAAGAFLGAPLRFALAGWFDSQRFPAGTCAVNVAGSFLLGLLSGAAVHGDWLALLGTGFCGGFTTYSAFAVQTHRRGLAGGTAYAVATVAVALVACFAGFALGRALGQVGGQA
jgi:CrcB protein